jgi:DNA (cytosine-5)-methyltransferase 1
MENDPIFIIVDLFCGAGGTTTGFVQAELEGKGIAKVIACVNHDPKAIKSHWLNHPEVKHFEEDIRTLDLTELIKLVEYYRKKYPNAYLILWASLECTNFSKAKGGQPRDADSRTLADHLERYVKALNPDYIEIENVVEFMSWGPLDENGKPVSRKNGQDWMRWRKEMCDLGYVDQWKELNSANFGAYTSRNRLFGVFARPWLPMSFPEPTHAKNPSKHSMHGDLKKWKAVKEVLDFKDEGESIFTRKKPLSDKTLERIHAGLVKYVAKGDVAFISKYFSGRPKGKVNSVDDPGPTVTTFGGNSLVQTTKVSDLPVDGPTGAITTIDHHALVQASFIAQRNSGDPESKIVDLDGPARTITGTGGNQDLVQPKFLTHYYGSGGLHSSVEQPAPVIPCKARTALVSPEFLTIYNGKSLHRSVDEPSPVIPTNDRLGLVQPEFFIDKHYGASQNQSIDQPAGVVMPNDKHRLVQCDPFIMPTNFSNTPKSIEEPAPTITADRHHHYIVNPSHGGHTTSTEAPCPVIVARQDKAPLYLVQVNEGKVAIAVYDGDSEVMIRIKQFMAVYSLVDIKMRMLRVNELLNIQGFPEGYKLEGNQADQKKFIGNSVVPHVVKAWTESMAQRIIEKGKYKAA